MGGVGITNMYLKVLLVSLCVVVLLRLLYLLYRRGSRQAPHARSSPCRTMVVLGSGGHTAEMLRLLAGLRTDNYQPRVYVAAVGDQMSVKKAGEFEARLNSEADVRRIPRARKVQQSYFTSVFSTLYSFACSFSVVWGVWPDLILCNGPGTCIPLCAVAYLITFTGLHNVKIVYIESICRVQALSLSGKLLYYFADNLVVQWPELQQKYSRTSYLGRIFASPLVRL